MRPIILDTETTGLKEPQVVEVGYLELNSDLRLLSKRFEGAEDQRLVTFCERFKPDKPIDPFAEKVHGISLKDVQGCRPHTDFSLPQHNYFIAHNARFDWAAVGKPKTKIICTLGLARQVFSKGEGVDVNLRNHKLTTLIVYLYPEKGTEMIKNSHGALQDCVLTYHLLIKILERMPYIESWSELCSMCKQPKDMPS